MIGYWHHPVVCLTVRLSVCDAVHCGSQGRCTGLKVVPACSLHAACSYLSLQTLMLYDVSFSHKMHYKKTSRRNTRVLVYIVYLLLTRMA